MMKSRFTEDIVFFFDFSDPLSYIVSTQVEGWCVGAGLSVRWRALSKLDINYNESRRRTLAAILADTFGYPLFNRQILNSRPAARASILARDADSISQFIMRVFQFWYATDLPPYADILFDGLASDCALSEMELKAALENEQHWTSRLLSLAEKEAHDLGVEFTPTIVAANGNKIVIPRLNHRNPLDELLTVLSNCGLSQTHTAASRCYLPFETMQTARYCRWCTCGKKPL